MRIESLRSFRQVNFDIAVAIDACSLAAVQ